MSPTAPAAASQGNASESLAEPPLLRLPLFRCLVFFLPGEAGAAAREPAGVDVLVESAAVAAAAAAGCFFSAGEKIPSLPNEFLPLKKLPESFASFFFPFSAWRRKMPKFLASLRARVTCFAVKATVPAAAEPSVCSA